MSDYISREAAIDLLKRLRKDGDMIPWEGKKVFHSIRNLPAADVKPVVRGEWCSNGLPGSMLYGCSECGFTCGTYAYFFNYCPNCGARMEE